MLAEMQFEHLILDYNDIFVHVEEVSWLGEHISELVQHSSMFCPKFSDVWMDVNNERNLECAMSIFEGQGDLESKEALTEQYKRIKKVAKKKNWARSLRILMLETKAALKIQDDDMEETLSPLGDMSLSSDVDDPENGMFESEGSRIKNPEYGDSAAVKKIKAEMADKMAKDDKADAAALSPRQSDSPRSFTADVQQNDVPQR